MPMPFSKLEEFSYIISLKYFSKQLCFFHVFSNSLASHVYLVIYLHRFNTFFSFFDWDGSKDLPSCSNILRFPESIVKIPHCILIWHIELFIFSISVWFFFNDSISQQNSLSLSWTDFPNSRYLLTYFLFPLVTLWSIFWISFLSFCQYAHLHSLILKYVLLRGSYIVFLVHVSFISIFVSTHWGKQ